MGRLAARRKTKPVTASGLSPPSRGTRALTSAVATAASTASPELANSSSAPAPTGSTPSTRATAMPNAEAWETATPRKICSRATTHTPTPASSTASIHPAR